MARQVMTIGYIIRFYKYLEVKKVEVELSKMIQKNKFLGVI